MRKPSFHIAELRRQLGRQGIWGGRASRLIEEWSDHAHEKAAARVADGGNPDEAEAEAWRALGDPATLAAGAARELAAGSWLGRHPWLGGMIVPVILWLVALNAVLFGGAWLAGFLGEGAKPHVSESMEFWWPLVYNWVPWMGAMAWLTRIAIRMPGGWRLYWITAVALMLCSTMPYMELHRPLHGPGSGMLNVGVAGPLSVVFGIPASFIWHELPPPSAQIVAQGHLWLQALLMVVPVIALRWWAKSRGAAGAAEAQS